jgi:hypothetical protein
VGDLIENKSKAVFKPSSILGKRGEEDFRAWTYKKS